MRDQTGTGPPEDKVLDGQTLPDTRCPLVGQPRRATGGLKRNLPCGTISINSFSEGDIKTPFGGYKRSGSLARDNGTEALQQYVQTKTVWIAGSAA